MALFGAPVPHEDDPERAVRAALAIRASIAELNQVTPGLDLHVRIGVTTGEALVALDARPGEGMASGDVVNTAARLQAAAPTDGVLVDATTQRATDRAIRFEQADPIVAKGKAEPVVVWQALAPRASLGVDLPPAPRRAAGSPLRHRSPARSGRRPANRRSGRARPASPARCRRPGAATQRLRDRHPPVHGGDGAVAGPRCRATAAVAAARKGAFLQRADRHRGVDTGP